MDITPSNIIVNSCEYTPVYLISNPGVTQAGSYFITQGDQDTHNAQKPVTDNLKRFYENSGNLENGILGSPKPRILKKQSNSVIGNNLKLASFLLPKTEPITITTPSLLPVPIPAPVIKPPVTTVSTNTTNVANTVPKMEYERKIVRIGTIPIKTRAPQQGRVIRKSKPKENTTPNPPKPTSVQLLKLGETYNSTTPNPSKHTSVQLLKLGETYHSLNQLSSDQMKIVNQALKIFSDPEKIPKEPAYDPVTNTKFIYKIVSPRDLTVVGKNKVAVKNKKNDINKRQREEDVNINENNSPPVKNKKIDINKRQKEEVFNEDNSSTVKNKKIEISKRQREEDLNVDKTPMKNKKNDINKRQREELINEDNSPSVKNKKNDINKRQRQENFDEENSPTGPKVTRSGRTVKPKQIVSDETPHKPRKKSSNVVTCFQCCTEFCSLYRLQRHYENYPTHIPAKTHMNLFHCLLAIIKGSSDVDQANIFIQQLEQLIEKLKSLLPCLMKVDSCEGKQCTINEDIGRMFGINPGKYSLNMNALNCVKNKDGHCIHNPAPKTNQFNTDASKPSQIWLTKHNEEVANEASTEDCARINSVDKWPTISKRVWKHKQRNSEKVIADRMRLTSESGEQIIELDDIDSVSFVKPDSVSNVQNQTTLLDDKGTQENNIRPTTIDDTSTSVENQSKKPKAAHAQFRSTHFDIRSSPIKPSALVRKFQFHPDKLSTLEVQVMRPLALDNADETSEVINVVMPSDSDPCLELQNLLNDSENIKDSINSDLHLDNSKIWSIAEPPCDEQSHTDYIQSNLFETGLTPVKDNVIEPALLHIKDDQNVLYKLPSKSNGIIESIIQPKSSLVEQPLLMQLKDKPNGLFEPTPIHVKTDANCLNKQILRRTNPNVQDQSTIQLDKSNRLFESTSIHVTEANGLIESNFIQDNSIGLLEPSIIHLKDKSNGLFEPTEIQIRHDSNNLINSNLLHTKDTNNGLYESSLIHAKEKSKDIFETALSRVKDRASNLFEPPVSHINNKNTLIGSLIDIKDKSDLFETALMHTKDNMIDSSMTDMKERCNNLVESELMHMKDKTSVDLDLPPSDHLDTNDNNRLMSSQGQSVLNFLETLGNELAYPETEIRNNAVDFQLDLFSFNSS